MTGVPAPTGWETHRPQMPGSVGRWRLSASYGDITIDLWPPHPGDRRRQPSPPRVEIHTGPASFGPALTDPPETRRYGWALLTALQAAAQFLEHGVADHGPVEPDPHMTIFDFEELARHG